MESASTVGVEAVEVAAEAAVFACVSPEDELYISS
jgi:hypothetical protein